MLKAFLDQPRCVIAVGFCVSSAQLRTPPVSSIASIFRKQCGLAQIHSVTVPLSVTCFDVSKLALPWCATTDAELTLRSTAIPRNPTICRIPAPRRPNSRRNWNLTLVAEAVQSSPFEGYARFEGLRNRRQRRLTRQHRRHVAHCQIRHRGARLHGPAAKVWNQQDILQREQLGFHLRFLLEHIERCAGDESRAQGPGERLL